MKNELWLTWKEPYSRRRYKVGVLSKEEKNYIFKYENPELDAATEKGFKYFPGFEDANQLDLHSFPTRRSSNQSTCFFQEAVSTGLQIFRITITFFPAA